MATSRALHHSAEHIQAYLFEISERIFLEQHFDRAHVSGSIAEKDPRGKIRYGESGRRLL